MALEENANLARLLSNHLAHYNQHVQLSDLRGKIGATLLCEASVVICRVTHFTTLVDA